jgi:hypothetical protein
VVAPDDEVRAAVVLPHDGVQHRLPRSLCLALVRLLGKILRCSVSQSISSCLG